MFRWSGHDFSDEFISWLHVAEQVATSMNAKHPKLGHLDDERLIVLASGMSELLGHLPVHNQIDPIFGRPPSLEADVDYGKERRKLEQLQKQAEKLRALLSSGSRSLNAIRTTFGNTVDPSSFFDDPEAYVFWPANSLHRNPQLDAWLIGLDQLQRSISAAIELLDVRASVSDPPPTGTTIVTIRSELIPALFKRVYPGATEGGTNGGRALVGPLYTFQEAVLTQISDLRTTAGSLRQARYRRKTRYSD